MKKIIITGLAQSLFFSLFFLFGWSSVAQANGLAVSVNDPHLFVTPENWIRENNELKTNCPGAYLKLAFTGTSFQLVVDTSPQMLDQIRRHYYLEDGSPGPHQELPKIGFAIDAGETQYLVLPTAAPSVVVTLAQDLPPGTHQIKISLEGLGRENRWNDPTDQLMIRGFQLDRDAQVLAPLLRPKRMVVYGDSITEGANMIGKSATVATKQWSTTWDADLAKLLDAEVSVIAYQGQGYHNVGAGQVPNFPQSYAWLRGGGYARKFSDPDYVFVLQGTNGGATVHEIEFMMQKIREAYPFTKIFFGVDFDSTLQEQNHLALAHRQAIDARLAIFDLGDAGADTLMHHSFDLIHPNVLGHAQIAQLIFEQIFKLL
jgi:lysophospholipase L1-like esterase